MIRSARHARTHPKRTGAFAALALLAVVASALGGPLAAGDPARADVPTAPVTAPFDAPACAGTVGDPSVDADGGPVTDLLDVFGARLTGYNAGDPVILYNNNARSGWTSTNSQYSANPLCSVRYVAAVGGPVSSWTYCTYDRASSCGWTNGDGALERNGVVLPALQSVGPDNRLTADQQKLQAYIIQNDLPVIAGPNGSGGTVAADTTADDSTPASRTLRQNLVHCIDNPARDSGLVFCANNMSPATQARILAIVDAAPGTQLAATGPSASVLPGAEGRIHLTTTLAGIPLTLAVTGGTVTVCDGPATLTGSTVLVDEDAALPADITLCATRADAGTVTAAITGEPPVIANVGFAQSGTGTLCQIFATYRAERQTTVSTDASVTFADAAAVTPVIGTTLVDAADGDHVLPFDGGSVVDTIAYQNLTPGTSYTVQGELVLQSDGSSTGSTGSTTFTPATTEGTTTVTFTVPSGHAGTALVAFETLYASADTTTPIAEHKDLSDAAQTVAVEAPGASTPTPAPASSAVPAALASTGMDLTPAPFAAAMALLALGATILLFRRRTRVRG